jgi:hypothetical protein
LGQGPRLRIGQFQRKRLSLIGHLDPRFLLANSPQTRVDTGLEQLFVCIKFRRSPAVKRRERAARASRPITAGPRRPGKR